MSQAPNLLTRISTDTTAMREGFMRLAYQQFIEGQRLQGVLEVRSLSINLCQRWGLDHRAILRPLSERIVQPPAEIHTSEGEEA